MNIVNSMIDKNINFLPDERFFCLDKIVVKK